LAVNLQESRLENLKKVLIISPHFPPINLPDYHRIRSALPHFHSNGWEPIILCVDDKYIYAARDEQLAATIPKDVEVVKAKVFFEWVFRFLHISDIAIRSCLSIYNLGSKIIRERKIDLVYFSTTSFLIFKLGPLWLRKMKVPYVLDYQDPWINDYYHDKKIVPPGGWIKFSIQQYLAKWFQPKVLRKSAHVTVVSSAYVPMLQQQCSGLDTSRFTVLPFSACENDLDFVRLLAIKQNIFDPNDGKMHCVYTGTLLSSMRPALELLFLSVQQLRKKNPAKWNLLRLHFVGTNYTLNVTTSLVFELASKHGIGDLVDERPERIPYLSALKVMLDSHLLLMIGSNDAGYSPSKIYSCLMTRKKIIALAHEGSSFSKILRHLEARGAVNFFEREDGIALQKIKNILEDFDFRIEVNQYYCNEEKLSQYKADAMTRKITAIFDLAIKQVRL